MKRIIILIIGIIGLSGCVNINSMKMNDIVNNFSTNALKSNNHRTGYSYYLPRNMKVEKSSLYNEVLESERYKYYLYVDVVSYYKKVEKDYKINKSAIYSQSINYQGKYGYIEINLLKNDKYLVEIMYNYAKIEVIVDKDKCNEAVLSIINILKSVEYNDSIIANLMGDDILNYNEVEFNIFNTKGNEKNYLTVTEEETETEDTIPDPDLLN